MTRLDKVYSVGDRTFCTFQCQCGNIVILRSDSKSISCGCFHWKATHRKSKTRAYRNYSSMKTRCSNPKDRSYPNYGGRGIKVCERWLNSYEHYLEDIGPAPSPNHTLDRIDNDKGYYKENCRWATKLEQNRNKRNAVYLDGVRVTDLAKQTGVPINRLYYRYHKNKEAA